jgi:glycosyltransferase involved in cell wall biosynthesis
VTIADVDVIVPVRNGGALLREAVDSVLAQEGVNVHVIVVDDGSTDGAPKRLQSDPRLRILARPARGLPAALNAGLEAGTAPLVARQDADDRSLPGRLAAEAAHLERHPGIGLVATAFEVLVGDRVVVTMGPGPAGMLERNPICAGSTVVRREVMECIGGYREAFRACEDYDAWLRCGWTSGVSILSVVGYQYRLTASMSTIVRADDLRRFGNLARASALARLNGSPDPAERAEDYVSALADECPNRAQAQAETLAWWAREFAALGARRESLRCVAAAARVLPAGRTAGLLRAALGRPVPQAQWT